MTAAHLQIVKNTTAILSWVGIISVNYWYADTSLHSSVFLTSRGTEISKKTPKTAQRRESCMYVSMYGSKSRKGKTLPGSEGGKKQSEKKLCKLLLQEVGEDLGVRG